MVKYQNSYVTSFLFKNNFFELIEKGLYLADLFNSNIFCFQFDYDEWPSTHFDEETYLKPYNGSIFELRKAYKDIFTDD